MSIATRLRKLPWWGVIVVVLMLSVGITVLLEEQIGFKEHPKLDEVVSLIGALLLAWPGLSLNAAARQRSNLDEMILKLILGYIAFLVASSGNLFYG